MEILRITIKRFSNPFSRGDSREISYLPGNLTNSILDTLTFRFCENRLPIIVFYQDPVFM